MVELKNVIIHYPVLVEQMYKKCQQQGVKLSKKEIYKKMVELGMLDQTGEPTKLAIDNGLVVVFEAEHETLSAFKKQYSVFKKYKPREFCQVNKVWYISETIANEIEDYMKKGYFNQDEVNQVVSYYELRNYDNPQSVQEFKAVNYPLYEKYDDSQFAYQDGQVLMTLSVTRDFANRVLNGEIDGNKEKAMEMLRELDSYDER